MEGHHEINWLLKPPGRHREGRLGTRRQLRLAQDHLAARRLLYRQTFGRLQFDCLMAQHHLRSTFQVDHLLALKPHV